MSTRSEFVSAWEDYRRRRRWAYGTWLGGSLVACSLAVLFEKLSLGEIAFWVFFPV
jgi:hypothetical protein